MRTGKLFMATIMVLGIMLSLVACESGISGEYTFHSVTFTEYDETFDSSSAGNLDDISIILYDDGSGILFEYGESYYIEYDDSYIWIAGSESDKIPYSYKNGKITIKSDGMAWVLKKG